MKTMTTVAHTLVRLAGLTAIVLGVLFWTGNARVLIPVHMLIGLVSRRSTGRTRRRGGPRCGT